MLQAAIVALVLATGGCPACERERAYGPNAPYGMAPLPAAMGKCNPLPARPAFVQTIPCPIVGCVGRNCDSCSRPLTPGAMPFDYRTDFNYPWSQTACALPMAAHYRQGPILQPPGDRSNPAEEIPAPRPEARRGAKSPVTVRRGDVLVSDVGQPLGPTRLR